MTDQEQREECRRAVRGYLAARSVLAYRATTLQEKLWKENHFTIEEIKAALEFELGRGHIESIKDPDGATLFYKVTAEGILFHERN